MDAEINQTKQNPEKRNKKDKVISIINFILLFLLIAVMGINQILFNDINKVAGIEYDAESILRNIVGGGGLAKYNISGNRKLTGDISKDAVNLVISKGVPDVYGSEMGISFDEVQSAINVMRQYDPYDFKAGGKIIIPTGDNLQRYKEIGSKIACEYCCGAKALINKDGKAACQCAHSMAMRGLAAYLIQNHGNEYTNDQILKELALWKGMYFPKQMIQKMTTQLQSGSFTPDVAALIIGLKLPDYGKGNTNAPLPSEIKDAPNMVGGC